MDGPEAIATGIIKDEVESSLVQEKGVVHIFA
jgi:hypothetical protein